MVKSKSKLINFLFYYNVIQYLLALIPLWYLDKFAYQYWVNNVDRWIYNTFSDAMQLIILGASLLVWGYFFFTSIRRKRYKKLTGGRNFEADKNNSQRNYYELVKYYKDADPHRLQTEAIRPQDWRQCEGVILGKYDNRIIRRPSSANGNLAVFGLPGKGKTSSIIIPTALRFSGAVFCIDIKGDIHAVTHTKRTIKVFSPGTPSESCHYNVLKNVDKMSPDERRKFIEEMSFVICPEETGDNRFFSDGARNFFNGICLYLIDQKPTITFPEIVQEILLGNGVDWVIKIKGSECLEAKLFTDSMYGSNEKNVSGCYENLASKIRPFSNSALKYLLDGKGDCIDPDYLNDGYDIYLRVDQTELNVFAPLLTIITQQFLTAFLNRPSGLDPIIFLLDEFPQLHFDFTALSTALSTLRSRNVTLLLCQQSLSQLDKLYGEAGRKTIMDTCEYYGILSIQDPSTRQYFSQLIGTKKVLKMSKSSTNPGDPLTTHYGKSSTEAREPIFQPEEFGNLDGEVIIYYQGKYIKAKQTPYYL